MPVAKSAGSVYSFTTNYQTSSIHIYSLFTTTVHIEATTAMFSDKIEAFHGNLNVNYIFIDDQCEVSLKDDVKINGKVFLVNRETFDNIWWTWTNQGMLDYLDEHKIQGVEYHNEPYKTHFMELVQLHENSTESP